MNVNSWRILLLPLSWLYGLGSSLRNWLYDVGILSITKVNVPVISVGNLTVGGTGKTPMVEYLIRYFQQHRKNVAVLSRGYKRLSKGTITVKAEQKIRGSAELLGDEPYQIATKFPTITVVVDAKRVRGAKIAEQHNADVILLDDGFQHRSLHRDLDIVMMGEGAAVPPTAMIPAGMLREPFSSLKRAHVLVSQGKSQKNFFSKPQISISYRPISFKRLEGNSFSLNELREKKFVVLCGIANPESFKKMLQEQRVQVLDWLVFPDHYRYRQSDMETVVALCQKNGAELILTTEKDAARLRNTSLHFPREMFSYVEIEVKIEEGEEVFHSLLQQAMKGSVI
jgi:tetraacyldisaccharide 4'-kinase